MWDIRRKILRISANSSVLVHNSIFPYLVRNRQSAQFHLPGRLDENRVRKGQMMSFSRVFRGLGGSDSVYSFNYLYHGRQIGILQINNLFFFNAHRNFGIKSKWFSLSSTGVSRWTITKIVIPIEFYACQEFKSNFYYVLKIVKFIDAEICDLKIFDVLNRVISVFYINSSVSGPIG